VTLGAASRSSHSLLLHVVASRTGCGSGSTRSSGRWARAVQRLLALNTAIWHNWQTEAVVSFTV